MTSEPVRVCLDARLADGVAGGIQQFIMGLASGLSRLGDSDDEYLFLSSPDERAWLTPHLAGPCRPLDAPRALAGAGAGSRLQLVLRAAIDRAAASPLGAVLPVRVPASDGLVERSGCHVVHFTRQGGFRTALPSIYQPYDLQHVHLPQFFSAYGRRWRDRTFALLSGEARTVVVMSSWVKEDVVKHLRLPPEKVRVVPWAPVTEEYPEPTPEDLVRTAARLRLPEHFALYPAQTFPHKNHLALVEAVALAKRAGAPFHVVCPGTQTEHYAEIERRIAEAGVASEVTFPGYVSPLELRCLYRLATLLVFPSLFEGGGMPVFEAFAARLAVACSDVTCLPKQAGDAALLFDPRKPDRIADALTKLWRDADLRAELVRRGSARVRRFTWDRTARMYRALYREAAGRRLGDEDRALLDAPPDT
jgi:glycosyltransferase involved in cell wall biosynthesis